VIQFLTSALDRIATVRACLYVKRFTSAMSLCSSVAVYGKLRDPIVSLSNFSLSYALSGFSLRSTIWLFLFALVSPIHSMVKQVGRIGLFIFVWFCLLKVDGRIWALSFWRFCSWFCSCDGESRMGWKYGCCVWDLQNVERISRCYGQCLYVSYIYSLRSPARILLKARRMIKWLADVNRISANELVMRKAKLVLTKTKS
jgi:hypothetical protein